MPKPQQPQPNETLDELKHAYLSVFTSEAGKVILEDLQATYCGSAMVKGDPYATSYNVGAQDVVKGVEGMIALSLTEDEHNAG